MNDATNCHNIVSLKQQKFIPEARSPKLRCQEECTPSKVPRGEDFLPLPASGGPRDSLLRLHHFNLCLSSRGLTLSSVLVFFSSVSYKDTCHQI